MNHFANDLQTLHELRMIQFKILVSWIFDALTGPILTFTHLQHCLQLLLKVINAKGERFKK